MVHGEHKLVAQLPVLHVFPSVEGSCGTDVIKSSLKIIAYMEVFACTHIKVTVRRKIINYLNRRIKNVSKNTSNTHSRYCCAESQAHYDNRHGTAKQGSS